jgi:hypothetical protein
MDITATLEAKSSQLNTDDLIAGPKTITITKVSAGSAEQPVAVSFEGDGGKPWYPCKSMRRVLVAAWGADASQYVGRQVTLFRDPSVIYGGIAVGGIRVSHLSDLDGPLSIALTVTRQKRSPYKVQPLPASPPAPAKPAPPVSPAEDLIQAAAEACRRSGLTNAGIAAFVLELTKGNTSALSDAPLEALAEIVRRGVSPQTVKRCNGKPEEEPQAPNSEATPSSPNLGPSSLNLGPSSLILEATSGPERLSPATEPGTVQRLPVGRTIVATDPQPAPAPAPAAPAAGRRSAPAPVRRSGPGAAPAAEAPIPGLD